MSHDILSDTEAHATNFCHATPWRADDHTGFQKYLKNSQFWRLIIPPVTLNGLPTFKVKASIERGGDGGPIACGDGFYLGPWRRRGGKQAEVGVIFDAEENAKGTIGILF